MGGGGLGGLSFSSGPAMSEANSGGGSVGTGDFIFKPKGDMMQTILPWVAAAGIVWLLTRKK